MSAIYDVAIVGAGPAGLVAATQAARHALATVLFDEHDAPGGTIHRAVTASPLARPGILGEAYGRGAALVEAFRRSGATYVSGATVWAMAKRDDAAYDIAVSRETRHAQNAPPIAARAVILATGAHERPFPIPGWTLPGVMTAGAAQLLLKSAAVVPAGRTLLAGCGPLLWLLAWQYLNAGVEIEAILDTTPRGRMRQALPHAADFLRSRYFGEGLKLVRDVRRNVRVVEYVTSVAAEGTGALEVVRFGVPGRIESLPCDLLLLHQGVVPEVSLPGAMGCALRWNERQACFEAVVDSWGGSSAADVFIAGDGADIAGAEAAAARGHLAALAVANALGRIDGKTRDAAAERPRAALRRALRGRRFLDTLFRPADAFRIPEGNTIVCRCEEVAARQVIDAVALGCTGPNQVKAFLRCGMGSCQGRFCALTVTEMIARARKVSPADIGCYRYRFPVKPVTLAELAMLPSTPEAERAVDRTLAT